MPIGITTWALMAGLLLGAGTTASAATHQVTLHARVASDFGDVSAGDSFDATFSFDPALPNIDLAPGDTNLGTYYNALSAGTVSIGSRTWTQKSGGLASLQVLATPGDSYLNFAFEVTGPSLLGTPPDLFVLQGKAVNSFSSDAMPLGSVNDGDFDYMIGSLNFGSKGAVVGWGKWQASPFTDTSFHISAVPEPPIHLLLGVGLAAIGWAQARKNRPSQKKSS